MKKFLLLGLCAVALAACQPAEQVKTAHQLNMENSMEYTAPGKTDTDHLWLEDVLGEKALAKVRGWNEHSEPLMQGAVYKDMKAELLEVYNSPEKIPYISYRAGMAHNFWQDDKHVKGIWRTTSLESYRTDDPKWETVLDIDAVSEREDKNWVYKGNSCLTPDYNRCIVSLSVGGKDATERREFDVATKSFVKDGFFMPESKGGTSWVDKDHLLVGVDFGPDKNGNATMTDSGYPLISKLWTRGTPLSQARELMRGQIEDVAVWPGTFENANGDDEILIVRSTTFYTTEYYWIPQTGANAWKPVQVPIPAKTNLGDQFKGQQLVTLQEDWPFAKGEVYKSGALVSFSIADFMEDGKIDTVHEVITPTDRQSIENTGVTKSALLLSLFENVAGARLCF